jgi:hypothetical protein
MVPSGYASPIMRMVDQLNRLFDMLSEMRGRHRGGIQKQLRKNESIWFVVCGKIAFLMGFLRGTRGLVKIRRGTRSGPVASRTDPKRHKLHFSRRGIMK